VLPGASSRSYGVAVAKLAGLPEPVLARARAVLFTLESEAQGGDAGSPHKARPARQRAAAPGQLELFSRSAPSPQQREILETLREVDVDRLTPLQALELLAQLKKRL
jgi:DNA mismatch repair protein MutS